MTIKYNIVTKEGDPTSAVVLDESGETYTAGAEHPNFATIVSTLTSPDYVSDEEIIALFDKGVVLNTHFKALSDRVSISNGVVYFDLEPQSGALAATILKFYQNGHTMFEALVNFMEKLANNPNQHSREQAYRWIERNDFVIHADGDLIAYKGVNRQEGKDGKYMSSNAGNAVVNGVPFSGRIPTSPGTIVEMPRSEVAHDPNVACHTGLHVGNWSYARSFASVVLQVKVNPRDIVSVPTDSSDAKMRVCRYRVLDEVTKPDPGMLSVRNVERTLVDELTVRKQTTVPVPTKPVPKKSRASKAVKATTAAVKKATTKVAPKSLKGEAKAKPPAKKNSAVSKKTAKPVPVKKSAAKTAAKPTTPKYYEDFKKDDFAKVPYRTLRWLAGDWELKVGSSPKTDELVEALAKAAVARRRRKQPTQTNVK